MVSGPLGVVMACASEARWLQRCMQLQQQGASEVGRYWYGSLHGLDVVLIRCGVGPERAAQAVCWLTQQTSLRAVLSAGFAGGLRPRLVAGEAIVATEIHSWTTQATEARGLRPDRQLQQMVTTAAQAVTRRWCAGILVSTSTVVAQTAAKQALRQDTGAVAVDMESYSIGQAACRAHLPFTTLRVIFDPAEEACLIPPEVAMTSEGVLQPQRLTRYLIDHPGLLVRLPRVWRQAQRAGHALQQWFDAFCRILHQTA